MEVPRTDLCDIIIKHISIMERNPTNTPGNTPRGTQENDTAPGTEKNQERRPNEQGKAGDATDATRTNPGQDRSGQPDGKKDDRQPAHPTPDHDTEREEGNDASRTRAEDKGPDAHRGNKMPDGQKTQVENSTK
jgi:hypothetical protein